MEKQTPFRNWLLILWQENCQEHEDNSELPYSMPEYFQKYKYWLKREYQHQMRLQASKTQNSSSDLVLNALLDDKLDSTGVTLLSDNQNRLLKTLKDNNEE